MSSSHDIVWMAIFGTTLFLIILFFFVSLIFLFFKKQLANQKENERLQSHYEQELLHARIEVQNETLKHIGRELHDNIGQLLSVARLNLNIFEDEHSLEDTRFIQETNEIIGKAVDEVRNLSKTFDGDFVKDFGFVNSLSQELDRINRTGKFRTQLNIDSQTFDLGYEKEIVAFRIVQESLSNIIRHSGASKIEVNVQVQPTGALISVQDNGKGFRIGEEKKDFINSSGSGLKNMKLRATLIGGTCQLTSELGLGTTVIVHIPIN